MKSGLSARLVVPLESSKDASFEFQVSHQTIRAPRTRMRGVRVRLLARCSVGRALFVDDVMWIAEVNLKIIVAIRAIGFLLHHTPTVCASVGRTCHPRILEKIAELGFPNHIRSKTRNHGTSRQAV